MRKPMNSPPSIVCHCFYREDDKCFLDHPGPMEVCQGYKPPTKVNQAPLDAEMAKKFAGINQK
jgi:hypothetical protein